MAVLVLLGGGSASAQEPPPAQAPPAPAPVAAAPPPPRGFPLSDPEGVSRWAAVEKGTVVRAQPALGTRRVARLHTVTPEGTAEVVLALERRWVGSRLWVRVRLPVLPNGTTGWVPRSRLSPYTITRSHLVVDRARQRLELRRSGRVVFRARVGVGRPRWPTPAGKFYVRSRLSGFDDPVYGPLAFGTSARSAVLTDWPGGGFIGIHGTNQPELIPGEVSHGCIRLRNPELLRLGRLLRVGTPLTIR